MSDAFVVLLKVHLHFPEAHSLKAKRSELKPVKAWLQQRMGAAVAEVDHHDVWQRSTLAVAFCGRTQGDCERAADAVTRFLDERLPQGGRVERSLASWEDLEVIR